MLICLVRWLRVSWPKLLVSCQVTCPDRPRRSRSVPTTAQNAVSSSESHHHASVLRATRQQQACTACPHRESCPERCAMLCCDVTQHHSLPAQYKSSHAFLGSLLLPTTNSCPSLPHLFSLITTYHPFIAMASLHCKLTSRFVTSPCTGDGIDPSDMASSQTSPPSSPLQLLSAQPSTTPSLSQSWAPSSETPTAGRNRPTPRRSSSTRRRPPPLLPRGVAPLSVLPSRPTVSAPSSTLPVLSPTRVLPTSAP